MEPVVYEESPLAEYLREGGNDSEVEWAPVESRSDRESSHGSTRNPSPPPYAPRGRPLVKARFRNKNNGDHEQVQRRFDFAWPWQWLRAKCSARFDGSDATKFLEQFRYAIIASQLLSDRSILGRRPIPHAPVVASTDDDRQRLLSTRGAVASVVVALAVAVTLGWAVGTSSSSTNTSSSSSSSWRRVMLLLLVLAAVSALLSRIFARHQRLLSDRRAQALAEMAALVAASQDFDSASEATLALVQEVELVSRGYHLGHPLPPISRIEDRSQSRKCVRLRKALLKALADALTTYNQATDDIKGFAEQMELDKYFDMYDVSDFDLSDARQGFSPAELEDPESLRTLRILAARFHTTRKMLLCALLALDASEDEADLPRWTAAVEALQLAQRCTRCAFENLEAILSEAGSFPLPPTPKSTPLTPRKERWRSQLRKLDSLSTGIRGLQAKLHLLREESDRVLDDSTDVSELGPSLMAQYDSIGTHLKDLMAAWEEGRTALALGIDRNEKRLSSMSTLLSPTSSLSGLTTTVEEDEGGGGGGRAEAFKALTGESPPASSGDAEEVFEAVAEARSRPRSLLTREARMAKMREEREGRAQAQVQAEATRGMLRELETVISLRPRKQRLSAPISGRIVSM